MQRVRALGYVCIEASDLDAWETFGTDVLGLQAERDGTASPLRFRMDEYRSRIIVYPGSRDDVSCLAWEVADEAALDAMAVQIAESGTEVMRGSEAEAAERGVTGLIRFADPSGIPSEVYWGAEIAFERPFTSPRPISGFVTGDQGLGHVVIAVDDHDASLAFYRDVLGFRVSDHMRGGPRPGTMSFLHCNPRHHTVAFFAAERPKRLLHIMLQAGSLDDVGATYSLCEQREVPLATSMGRHTNDHMVSFYLVSPSGFDIEYGWGGRTVDDATWKVQTHRSPSIWGHTRFRPRT